MSLDAEIREAFRASPVLGIGMALRRGLVAFAPPEVDLIECVSEDAVEYYLSHWDANRTLRLRYFERSVYACSGRVRLLRELIEEAARKRVPLAAFFRGEVAL